MSGPRDAQDIEGALGWKERPDTTDEQWNYLIQTCMKLAALLAEALARIETLEKQEAKR